MHPPNTSSQDIPETNISITSDGSNDNDKASTTPAKRTLPMNEGNSNNSPAESDTALPEMPALDPLSSPTNETTTPTSPKDSAASTSTPTTETNQDAVTTVDGKPDVALTEAMTDEPVNATAKPIAPVASKGQPVLQRSSSSQHQGSMSKKALGAACCEKCLVSNQKTD